MVMVYVAVMLYDTVKIFSICRGYTGNFPSFHMIEAFSLHSNSKDYST